MRILTVLTYYRPHTSGLTIYAERLCKALARRGHQVTVLTSQFEKSLAREEVVDGVRVRRVPVLLRISKGVIMPTLGFEAWREVLRHDALLLHLPQFDAAGIALRGRLLNKPTVITYHCDLDLPPGLFNRVVNSVVNLMNNLAALSTHRISAYTEDFATHSPYLRRYMHKVRTILPPVELPRASAESIREFGARHNPHNRRPIVGLATRFAAEKGFEVLLNALPQIIERYPNAMVLYAGQYENVMGEEAYLRRLMPTIRRFQEGRHWTFLGNLTPQEMAGFYQNIDLLVVPSTNSTETFGLVQIEAMMNGKPTVASDLPGVRQPPTMMGMGRVAPIGDADGLAKAILEVLDHPEKYRGDPERVAQQFLPDTNAQAYERLFEEIRRNA